jgi:hypothetical protein
VVVHFTMLLCVWLNGGPETQPARLPQLELNMEYSLREFEPKPGHPPFVDASVLFCEEPVFDFDEIWSGETVEHDFMITNLSPFRLWVNQGFAGAMTMPPLEIGPYETVPLHVRFTTRGYRGDVAKTLSVKVVGSATTRPAE